MKNVIIFLVCASMLFSCEDNEGLGTPAGILILPFMLFPRTAADSVEITKPLVYQSEEIRILQHDEKLLVIFDDPQTSETAVSIHHERLSADNLRYLSLNDNELNFRYPDGILRIDCDTKKTIWVSRSE